MKIEQDGFYLNAIGEILKIKIRGDGIPEDEGGTQYTSDGRYIEDKLGNYDLIGYIPKELHYGILQRINNYHTVDAIKIHINEMYKKDMKN